MRYIALLVIWFLFWLAGIVAPLVAVLRWLRDGDSKPISDTFHAQNRAAATVLGFDGKATISKECGRRPGCWLCKRLCRILSALLEDENHCEKEAKG